MLSSFSVSVTFSKGSKAVPKSLLWILNVYLCHCRWLFNRQSTNKITLFLICSYSEFLLENIKGQTV